MEGKKEHNDLCYLQDMNSLGLFWTNNQEQRIMLLTQLLRRETKISQKNAKPQNLLDHGNNERGKVVPLTKP